jgi:pilus assembly protein CpaB
MRPKSLALLVLALGCGLVASIGITQVMAKRDTKTEAPDGQMQTVFVAMDDIAMGEVLSPQALRLEQWPKDKVPSGALQKIEDIEGRRAKTKLYQGEPILENKLYGKGDTGGGVALRIPKGYRAVPVKVDDVSGGADMILPGDRVDVMVYLAPKGGAAGVVEASSQTLLEDIKVFAVDSTVEIDSASGSEPINAKTISLLVTPEQAAKVTLASQLGKIMLVMRSPDDDKIAAVPPVSVQDLFEGRNTGNRKAEDTTPVAQKGTVSDWLEKLEQESKAAKTPPPEEVDKPETWGVRIWSGPEVRDIVLQASRGESGADSQRWTVVEDSGEAGYSPQANLPETAQPTAEQEQKPAEEEPAEAQPAPTKQAQEETEQ